MLYWGMELAACMVDAGLCMYILRERTPEEKRKEQRFKIKAYIFLMLVAAGLFGSAESKAVCILSMLAMLLELFLYGKAVSTEKNSILIMKALLLYVSLGLIAMLVTYAVSTSFEIPVQELMSYTKTPARIVCICIGKLTLGILAFAAGQWDKELKMEFSRQEWRFLFLEYFVILLILLILLYELRTEMLSESGRIYLIIVGAGLVLIYFASFFILQRLSDACTLELEFQRAFQHFEQEKKAMKDRRAEYEKMRLFRHDMHHYIGTALGMVQKGEIEELSRYLQRVQETKLNRYNAHLVLEESMLEVVLNNSIDRMQQCGIRHKILVAENLHYGNEIDAGIILSNLLENAIEACLKCKEGRREILLSQDERGGYAFFRIENTIDASVMLDNPLLKTGKKDIKEHGLGLKSVRDMLEKQGGMMRQYEKDNAVLGQRRFITEITLPVMPKND